VPPNKHKALRDRFGLPPELNPIGTVAIGYPSPNDPRSRSIKRGHKPVDDVIHRGHW
jgi:nitroreductase